MTQNESIIFKASESYLERFGNPPPNNSPESEKWWEMAGNALVELANKHYNHPLVLGLGVAIIEYIELKSKAKEQDNMHKM